MGVKGEGVRFQARPYGQERIEETGRIFKIDGRKIC